MDKASQNFESLEPRLAGERVLGTGSMILMMIASNVAIAIFAIGSNLIGQLNLIQALVAIILGSFMISVIMGLNGMPGLRDGVPFAVQLRSSFGFTGAKLPSMVRGVPAIVWFGFQSWVGASAINTILTNIIGFDNVVVCFVIFQALHIVLSLKGFQGIKWLENIGAVVVIVALGYMFYTVMRDHGIEIADNIINIKGSWGIPFIGAAVVFAGNNTAIALNMSDTLRNYRKEKASAAHVSSIFFFTSCLVFIFMGLIGLIMTGVTGNSDPVAIFSQSIDNPILLTITLLFIVFSQLTTNVLSNVIPPTYILMDVFKITYKKAIVIVGILPVFTFPWNLVNEESAGGLSTFIRVASAFAGPVLAIMLVDYFIIRKKKLNLEKLYDPEGDYKGVNMAAVIATAIGVIAAALFIEISWLISLIPAGLSYYLLMKHLPSSKRFLDEEVK